MTFYLHPDSKGTLAKAYEDAFQSAQEIFVLSAFLRDWKSFEIGNQCTNATLIVGKDFGITRKKALNQTLAWKLESGYACHVYVADQIDGFHPKIVVWKSNKGYFLIIGSSNLTVAAFESNYEANVRIKIEEERYTQITDWIADVLAQSTPLTPDWISNYVESPMAGQRAKPKTAPKNPDSHGLIPPRFPGLAGALAERKEKAFSFRFVREEFERLVRECASEEIEQDDFYQWLLQHWNGSDWKFQGSGIFRHKQEATNWRLLCQALVRMLDSAPEIRDEVVRDTYDELEGSDEAEVRKAFITEMLCHFFSDSYPLWNKPVETWLQREGISRMRPRGLSAGEKYIWLAEQLRRALEETPDYPARDLAELDHVIWAYCRHRQWLP